ncbi:MAG: hypothetical protein BGN87_15010 [Rhizobiales bacterium 65-79]|nr:xanthine dehydrogenase family protein subunit M [Hyphomicrobiales bacterium]OJU05299.1 MAG: hypothetical protein BGN87_15010 [Rhizobiales bacterium 65-79]
MAFRIHRPETVDEASRLELDLDGDCAFIAGGTDLVVQMSRGQRAPAHLIDISRLPGMSAISEDGSVVEIGALVTHRELELGKGLPQGTDAIRDAARQVGGVQVRSIATLGGNIANASPAADLVPVLMVLDAELELRGPHGRCVPISDFIEGPRRTTRQPGELITAIRFRAPGNGSATSFFKAGRRKAMEIAVVNVAASVTLGADGACRSVRIALGSVAPKTLRAIGAEKALAGSPLSVAAIREAAQLAADCCAPITDIRASAEYRRLLVKSLVERALVRCSEQVEQSAMSGISASADNPADLLERSH